MMTRSHPRPKTGSAIKTDRHGSADSVGKTDHHRRADSVDKTDRHRAKDSVDKMDRHRVKDSVDKMDRHRVKDSVDKMDRRVGMREAQEATAKIGVTAGMVRLVARGPVDNGAHVTKTAATPKPKGRVVRAAGNGKAVKCARPDPRTPMKCSNTLMPTATA
jgi:hypothetical protein